MYDYKLLRVGAQTQDDYAALRVPTILKRPSSVRFSNRPVVLPHVRRGIKVFNDIYGGKIATTQQYDLNREQPVQGWNSQTRQTRRWENSGEEHITLALFLRNSNIVCDGKDHVYDGEHIDSENIGQFERDPHVKTTARARLDPKHVDKRTRIVQETANKIS
jgi:hypothetical protein